MPTGGYMRLRDLGHLEKYSSTRHALGLYNNVSVTAYYSKPARAIGQSLGSAVYRALAVVIQRHPVLSAIPVDEDLPTAHFLRLPTIDLNQVVKFIQREQVPSESGQSDSELDQVLELQHNTNFKTGLGDSPYWRLIITHDRDDTSHFAASFVFHHALADGGSGMALHRAFHAALLEGDREPTSDFDSPLTVRCPNTALVPSLEQLHPLPLGIWFILLAIWSSIFPTKTAGLWTGSPIDFSHQKRRIRTVAVLRDHTSALVRASRAHGSSLTAAIPVLLAVAVFTNLDASEWEILRASVPISLRHILPSDSVTNDTVGVFVSQTQSDYRRSALLSPGGQEAHIKEIWAAAKATKASLNAGVARNGRNDVVGMLSWAGPLKAYLEQKQGKQPESSFEFSNLGTFRYATVPAEGDWRVGRVIFGQDGNVVGPAFQTSGATGPDGCLTVGFAWLDGQVDEKWMDRVIRSFEAQVAILVADAPPP